MRGLKKLASGVFAGKLESVGRMVAASAVETDQKQKVPRLLDNELSSNETSIETNFSEILI